MKNKVIFAIFSIFLLLHSPYAKDLAKSNNKFFLRGTSSIDNGTRTYKDPSSSKDKNNSKISPKDLSLKEVTQLALINSLDIQIAKFDAYIERTSIEEAESIFDTFLSASASFRNDKKKPSTSLVGTKKEETTYSFGIEKKLPTGTILEIDAEDKKTDSNSSFVSVNPQREATLGISLTQSLGKNFFGLADRSNIKITKIDVENSEFTSLSAIEEIVYNVQVAYWNFALKTEELRIKQNMLKAADELYDIYKKKYTTGLAEKVDFFAVESHLRERENDVLMAELNKEMARNELLFLLNQQGLSINIRPQDSLEVIPFEVDLYDSLKEAVEHRRDYKIIKNEIESLDIDIEVKENALWPEIDLEASFTKNGLGAEQKSSWQDVIDESNSELFIGLSIKFPIENRLAKSGLEEAGLKKKQLILSLKRIERLILKDVDNRVKKTNMLKKQIFLFSSIAKLQENKLNEELKRLRRGRSGSDLIIRYEEDLLQARLSLALSFFEYRVSLIGLDLTKNALLDKYWVGEL